MEETESYAVFVSSNITKDKVPKIKNILESNGHHIIEDLDKVGVLKKLEELYKESLPLPDCIILDTYSGNIRENIKKIKSDERWKNIPVLIRTLNVKGEHLDYGADDSFCLSIEDESLQRVINYAKLGSLGKENLRLKKELKRLTAKYGKLLHPELGYLDNNLGDTRR